MKKTLWDWLQLLIIPVVLSIAGFWLSQFQKRREERITQGQKEVEQAVATDNQREGLLQAYIDNMSELLVEKHLHESAPEDELRRIARVRTLTVLSRLDGLRKRSVLQFLYEARLIDKGKQIIDLHGADLRAANLSEALLFESEPGPDFRADNLSGADLSGTDLSGADLSRANLSRASLRGARLWNTHLSEANLYAADLSEAYLRGTDLSEANASEANVSEAFLSEAHLFAADLSSADLSGARLVGADLSSTKLRGARLKGAWLSGAYLGGADLSGATLDGANLSGANLHHANLSGATLNGANLTSATLLGADLRGATLDGANLSYADLSRAYLGDVDLSRATLDEANLRDAQVAPEFEVSAKDAAPPKLSTRDKRDRLPGSRHGFGASPRHGSDVHYDPEEYPVMTFRPSQWILTLRLIFPLLLLLAAVITSLSLHVLVLLWASIVIMILLPTIVIITYVNSRFIFTNKRIIALKCRFLFFPGHTSFIHYTRIKAIKVSISNPISFALNIGTVTIQTPGIDPDIIMPLVKDPFFSQDAIFWLKTHRDWLKTHLAKQEEKKG